MIRIGVAVKLSKTNQWLTLVANVGVLAGIVFLGFELKQNNELLDTQIRATTLEQRQSISQLLFENPDVISLLGKDQKLLSDVELDRLRLLGVRLFVAMEHNYGEAVLGLQDLQVLETRYQAIYHRERLNYGLPIAWQVYKNVAEPDFVAWFEKFVINSS
jgi:hypothetical protein